MGREPGELGGQGREKQLLSRVFCRLLLEAVLWSGQWMGIGSSDSVDPCACCSTWLSQARGWEQFTVPYFSVSQQLSLYGLVLCVGAALSILLMGLGFSSQTNWKTALVAKLEGPAADAPEARQTPSLLQSLIPQSPFVSL